MYIQLPILSSFIFLSFHLAGQLSAPVQILEGSPQTGVVRVADFNKDGVEDMVVIKTQPYNWREETGLNQGLYLLIGHLENGFRSYEEVHLIEDRVYESDLIFPDYEGDGDMDIVYRDRTVGADPEFRLFENHIDSFSVETQLYDFFEALQFFGYTVVDLDGDSLSEYISTIDTFRVISVKDGIEHIQAFPRTNLLETTDVNGDSLMEILVSNSGQLQLLHADNGLNYTSETIMSDYRDNLIFSGNLDQDGGLELITRNNATDSFYLINNIENINTISRTAFHPSAITQMEILDLTGDGNVDILFPNRNQFLINDGNGEFTLTTPPLELLSIDWGGKFYQTLDNGVYQFWTRNEFRGFFEIQTYDMNTGSLTTEQVILPMRIVHSIDDAKSFDVNQDGYEDLVIASRWGAAFMYWEGQPNKHFGNLKYLLQGEYGARNFEFRDVNNDSIIDFCFAGLWSDRLGYALGDGLGNYPDKQYIDDDVPLMWGAAFEDFDGNGFVDALYTSIVDSIIYLSRNINGEFSAPEQVEHGYNYEDLIAKDYDLDGDYDLYVNNRGYLANDGMGNFTKTGDFDYLGDAFNHRHVDFDKDGDIDIITGLSTYMSNEGNTYEAVITGGAATREYYLAIDYNGDSYVDIVSPATDAYELYENTNNNSFSFDGIYRTVIGDSIPSAEDSYLTNIDVDGDGDLDALYVDASNLYFIEDLNGDPYLGGKVFLDSNQDSIFNDNDSGVTDIKVSLYESGELVASTYSDRFGNFNLYVEPGDYIIIAEPESECWNLLNSESINVSYDGTIRQDILVPVTLNPGEPTIDLTLSRAPTRCSFTIRYHIQAKNNGCGEAYGPICLELDSLIEQFSNISLENYDVDGNTICSESLSLLPGEALNFDLLIKVPSLDFLGEILNDQLSFIEMNIEGDTLSRIEENFFSVVQCAVDPNDKQATPDRTEEYDEPYILDETLEYTIRFQNVGTDTAFNIVITDTLSELLDMSTLRPVSASHDYLFNLDLRTREMRLQFNNILLPDSTTNEIESHGFFVFQIKPVEGLDDFDEIHNAANIFFDFNPPIRTNTVELVYIHNFGVLATDETEKAVELTFTPNPTSDVLKIESSFDYNRIEFLDLSGRLIWAPAAQESYDLSILESGLYLVKLYGNKNHNNRMATGRVIVVR